MAMITFKCRECTKRLFVKDELSGRRIQCPHCYKYLAVPVAGDRNWHLRGIGITLLGCVIVSAIVWIVYYVKNGGW